MILPKPDVVEKVDEVQDAASHATPGGCWSERKRRARRRRVRTWVGGLLGLFLILLTLGWITRGLWLAAIARSLVCIEGVRSSDAILVENFNPDYELFERAAALQQAGVAPRVLVPTRTEDGTSDRANLVAQAIAELMARTARVRNVEIVPIHEREPFSLNAAYQMRDFLAKERLRSVVVVSPAFRSRRTSFVYTTALEGSGLTVSCQPVLIGSHTTENWTTTWHGIEVVSEQLVKLQWYRFYILPNARHPRTS